MEVSQTGGTPSHHPFLDGLFPGRNHPAIGVEHRFGAQVGWHASLGHLGHVEPLPDLGVCSGDLFLGDGLRPHRALVDHPNSQNENQNARE